MDKSSGRAGITAIDVLQIVFIVLKLIGVIDWPWKWVLAPFWISIIVVILVAVGVFFYEKFAPKGWW